MTTVDGFKLLTDAQDYLLTVVRGVPADAWDAPTPCAQWTAGQVYHHARLDQQALTMQITGSAPPGDPFAPEAVAPADPAAELEQVCAVALSAWESGRDAESVPTPMGLMPAAQGASAAALDAALHAWDIGVATRQDVPLADALAEGLEGIGAFLIPFVRSTSASSRRRSRSRTPPVRRPGSSPSPAGTRTGRHASGPSTTGARSRAVHGSAPW